MVARCWVIAHDARTNGQYVYGLKLAIWNDETCNKLKQVKRNWLLTVFP